MQESKIAAEVSARKYRFRKRLLSVMALVLAATFALPSLGLLAGCNTVEGAGKDVKAAGQKVEGEAKEHKKY